MSPSVHQSALHLKLKAIRRQRNERAAWRALKRRGGGNAVVAMQNAIRLAEQYSEWSPWALDHTALLWIGDLLLSYPIGRIMEFGAGYSTIALAHFILELSLDTVVDSYEHQKRFADALRIHLPKVQHVNIRLANLVQLDDDAFESIFETSDPFKLLLERGSEVPFSQQHETRLQNVFYNLERREFLSENVDLVILDGPNGNGRSILYPLLKMTVKTPLWILIDDYQDYPFLKMLERNFQFEIDKQVKNDRKEYALLKLIAKH